MLGKNVETFTGHFSEETFPGLPPNKKQGNHRKSYLLIVKWVSRNGKWCYRWEFGGSQRSAEGDSDWCRSSRVLAVVNSLAELPWIKRSIISVRTEIWACNVSRHALIVSSTKSGEDLTLFFSFPPLASISTSPVTSSSWVDISNSALE